MATTDKNSNELSWYLAIVSSCVACLVAGSVLYLGYVDLQEGNAAWRLSGPDIVPKGNVAVRSVWGVIALLLSPMAFLLLFGFTKYRSRLAALPIIKQWLLAIGAPLCLVILLIAFCAIGVVYPKPVIIPYSTKLHDASNM